MLKGIAVDAGWLREIDGLSDADFWEATETLRELNARRVPLLLDAGYRIVGEYDRVLLERSLGRRYFTQAMTLGNFIVADGRPTAKCKGCLDTLAFDPSDRPYVGVAQRQAGMYLTHESKHLAAKVSARVGLCCEVPIVDLVAVRNELVTSLGISFSSITTTVRWYRPTP